MKIRITAELPVAECVRPEIGSVHEVLSTQSGDSPMYFINPSSEYRNQRVGVSPKECEVVAE